MHTSAHPSAPPAPVPSAHCAHPCVPDGIASPGAHSCMPVHAQWHRQPWCTPMYTRACPMAPPAPVHIHVLPCIPNSTASPHAHPTAPPAPVDTLVRPMAPPNPVHTYTYHACPTAPPAPVHTHAHLCTADGTTSSHTHPCAPDGTASPVHTHAHPTAPPAPVHTRAHPGTPRPVFTAAMCARTPHCSQPAWEPSRFLRWSFQVFLSFLRLPVIIFSGLLLQGPCESALDVPAQTRCSFSLSPTSLRLTVILSSLFPPFLHFWVLFWGPPSTSPTQLSQLCY